MLVHNLGRWHELDPESKELVPIKIDEVAPALGNIAVIDIEIIEDTSEEEVN